jgi:hypothetical protein
VSEPAQYTDEQMRAFARQRLSEDPQPRSDEIWPNATAREVAEREAAGAEVPTEAGAR